VSTSHTRPDAGFSLIEVLVVAVIMGILAAIAIPMFLSQRERGWQAQVVSDLRNAVLQAEAYSVGNGGDYDGMEVLPDLEDAASANSELELAWSNATGYCIQGVSTSSDSVVLHYDRDVREFTEGPCPE